MKRKICAYCAPQIERYCYMTERGFEGTSEFEEGGVDPLDAVYDPGYRWDGTL